MIDLDLDLDTASLDTLERRLQAAEATIARLRALQVDLVRRLDRARVDLADGARTMVEWVAARLDVSRGTARDLVALARASDAGAEHMLAGGEIGIERAAAVLLLRQAGGSDTLVARSWGYDLDGVARLTAGVRRITSAGERRAFEERVVVLQPALDGSSWRLWGRLPGLDGRVVEHALGRRGSDLPRLPDGTRGGWGQRTADALVSVCIDSLGTGVAEGRPVVVAEVFVEAAAAGPSGGETGVWVGGGPRVGPETLEEILCAGTVGVIVQGGDGRPIGTGDRRAAIPGAVRSFVWHRDQGVCAADGCSSRYRLQPHHNRPRSEGGDHDPANLTLLCWYHHHVVVHGLGFRIDPDSPPRRRRFLGWRATGPPLRE